MAALSMKLRIRLPWWWKAYLHAACVAAGIAVFAGLPANHRYIEALAGSVARTIARNVRIEIA